MNRVIVVVFVTIFTCFFLTFFETAKEFNKITSKDLDVIESELVDIFDETEKVLIATGKEIASKSPSLKLKEIHQIFISSARFSGDFSPMPWTMFDWVDIDGYQRVNTFLGIRKNAPQIARYRNYRNSGNVMWKMIFSEPAYGEPSKNYVIPVGVQISTPLYQQAGTVTSSINITRLVNSIASKTNKITRFALIDKRSSTIVASSSKNSEEKRVGAVYLSAYKIGERDNFVFEKDFKEKYPYILKVGYDEDDFNNAILSKTFSSSCQILLVSLSVFYFLAFKKKSTTNQN